MTLSGQRITIGYGNAGTGITLTPVSLVCDLGIGTPESVYLYPDLGLCPTDTGIGLRPPDTILHQLREYPIPLMALFWFSIDRAEVIPPGFPEESLPLFGTGQLFFQCLSCPNRHELSDSHEGN